MLNTLPVWSQITKGIDHSIDLLQPLEHILGLTQSYVNMKDSSWIKKQLNELEAHKDEVENNEVQKLSLIQYFVGSETPIARD